MEHASNTRLTAAEIANLWTQYQNDTAAICIHSHMYKKIEDESIRLIFEYALSISKGHIQQIKEFLTQEKYPIPQGFTPKDVMLDAPRLYSDALCLKYLHEITIQGMTGYAAAYSTSTRKDQREYYKKCSEETNKLYDMTADLLLSKGLYHRPPVINNPHRDVEYIQSSGFLLSGYFQKDRPLDAIEINNIFFNLKKSIITKAMLLGFSQSARSQEVRQFLLKAVEVKRQHISLFSNILINDDLNAPPIWDSEITNSIEPPLSDKLMMFYTGFLFRTAIAYYGAGIATSMRADLLAQYAKVIPQDIWITKEWANIMVENQWLEEPPKANDRTELARV